MLSIHLHIACALQITEDSKGSWGEVHFGHLLLIKESKLIFTIFALGGPRSPPFTCQTGGLARSTPTAAKGDWCATLLEPCFSSKLETHRISGKSKRWWSISVISGFIDFLYVPTLTNARNLWAWGMPRHDMLGNNAFGGLLVISRLEVLGTMFPWQAHKLSALPLSHRLQNNTKHACQHPPWD